MEARETLRIITEILRHGAIGGNITLVASTASVVAYFRGDTTVMSSWARRLEQCKVLIRRTDEVAVIPLPPAHDGPLVGALRLRRHATLPRIEYRVDILDAARASPLLAYETGSLRTRLLTPLLVALRDTEERAGEVVDTEEQLPGTLLSETLCDCILRHVYLHNFRSSGSVADSYVRMLRAAMDYVVYVRNETQRERSVPFDCLDTIVVHGEMALDALSLVRDSGVLQALVLFPDAMVEKGMALSHLRLVVPLHGSDHWSLVARPAEATNATHYDSLASCPHRSRARLAWRDRGPLDHYGLYGRDEQRALECGHYVIALARAVIHDRPIPVGACRAAVVSSYMRIRHFWDTVARATDLNAFVFDLLFAGGGTDGVAKLADL